MIWYIITTIVALPGSTLAVIQLLEKIRDKRDRD